jgi:hypothetical protein
VAAVRYQRDASLCCVSGSLFENCYGSRLKGLFRFFGLSTYAVAARPFNRDHLAPALRANNAKQDYRGDFRPVRALKDLYSLNQLVHFEAFVFR